MVLFTLHRFRLKTDRHRLFTCAVAATVATYIAMLIIISFDCLPFQMNWQVDPPPPQQCSMRMHDLYTSTILNIATDLIILAIPLPALWRMKVSLRKRIGLVLLLCSGIFVMSAAVIRFTFVMVGSTSVILNKSVTILSALELC